MNYPHPKQAQQQLWRKVSPTRYQMSPSYKHSSNSNLASEQPATNRQPQSKYTYGIKQLQQARHRSPSYNDPNQLSKLTLQLNQLQSQNTKLSQQNKTITFSYNRLVDQNRDYRSQIQFFRKQFDKLRTHINSTQSIRQQILKINKLLQEQKTKTQKYINENNKLVHEIKAIKSLLDSQRLMFSNSQKQKNEIKRLLDTQRKQKQQKMLIINQSRIMFQDEIRVLEQVKGIQENIKQLNKQIEEYTKEIESINIINQTQNQTHQQQNEIINKLQIELDRLKRLEMRDDVSISMSGGGGMSTGEIQNQNIQPIIRNLKIIFDEEKNSLLKQLNQKEIKLQQLTNRLESLTLGGDSQQELQNI